jgi:hypothetical protein
LEAEDLVPAVSAGDCLVPIEGEGLADEQTGNDGADTPGCDEGQVRVADDEDGTHAEDLEIQ